MLLNLEILIKKFSIKTSGVIHIGAHKGEEVEAYEELFDTDIPIHLFEPQKKYFEFIKSKYRDSKNIKLYEYGCGEKVEDLELNIASNDGLSSSVLEPKLHLEVHPDVRFTSKEVISLRTLDSFNILDSNFLNIDIQGYELNALRGSLNTLLKITYVYLEINKEEVYKGCPLVHEIDTFLDKFGFIRVSTKYASDKLPWGDALYVKKKELTKFQIVKSMIKKYIYNVEFLYKFYIILRKLYWKTKSSAKNK
jgi:FkbM family methyltransferase